jgi:hypothetical protein
MGIDWGRVELLDKITSGVIRSRLQDGGWTTFSRRS